MKKNLLIVGGIVVIIIAAIGFVKAYNGEWWKAPFIYTWSEIFKI
jgi:uncharacterized membrane protein